MHEKKYPPLSPLTFQMAPPPLLETHLESGLTPLLAAVSQEDTEMVKFLVPLCKDLNIKDKFSNRTVLHYAADNGDLEMMKILLPLVDDLFPKDKHDLTPAKYLSRSAFHSMFGIIVVTSEKHAETFKFFTNYVDEIISKRKMPQYDNLPHQIKFHNLQP